MNIGKYIQTEASVMQGKPTIRGTRITVELILRKIAEGATEEALLTSYPSLSCESVRAAIAYAADLIAHEEELEITA